METQNVILSVIASIACLSLVFFLIHKNREDLKTINPDASDATEEIKKEQERNRDKI